MLVFLLDPLRRIEGNETAAEKSERLSIRVQFGTIVRPSEKWVERGYKSNDDIDVDCPLHKLDTLPHNLPTPRCWSDPDSSATLQRSSQVPWIPRPG